MSETDPFEYQDPPGLTPEQLLARDMIEVFQMASAAAAAFVALPLVDAYMKQAMELSEVSLALLDIVDQSGVKIINFRRRKRRLT